MWSSSFSAISVFLSQIRNLSSFILTGSSPFHNHMRSCLVLLLSLYTGYSSYPVVLAYICSRPSNILWNYGRRSSSFWQKNDEDFCARKILRYFSAGDTSPNSTEITKLVLHNNTSIFMSMYLICYDQ